jgi:hypothetical protein
VKHQVAAAAVAGVSMGTGGDDSSSRGGSTSQQCELAALA